MTTKEEEEIAPVPAPAADEEVEVGSEAERAAFAKELQQRKEKRASNPTLPAVERPPAAAGEKEKSYDQKVAEAARNESRNRSPSGRFAVPSEKRLIKPWES